MKAPLDIQDLKPQATQGTLPRATLDLPLPTNSSLLLTQVVGIPTLDSQTQEPTPGTLDRAKWDKDTVNPRTLLRPRTWRRKETTPPTPTQDSPLGLLLRWPLRQEGRLTLPDHRFRQDIPQVTTRLRRQPRTVPRRWLLIRCTDAVRIQLCTPTQLLRPNLIM